jgi:polyisoprenoid-binding protein YceI
MIRIKPFVLLAALALLGGRAVGAQTAYTVRPESKVVLHGRSNVNSWSCATSTFQTSIGVDSSARSAHPGSRPRSVVRVTVTVPVRSLDCGRARMNEDMFRALKADSFPEIRYVLSSYEVEEQLATADSVVVHSVGELTVAGQTKRVEIQVNGARVQGGLWGHGVVKLLMTDFGIKPPTAFFGAIRTKNALEVKVEIRASQIAVAALRR